MREKERLISFIIGVARLFFNEDKGSRTAERNWFVESMKWSGVAQMASGP